MIQQLNTKISDDKKRNSRIIEDLNKNHKQEINDQYEQLQNLMDNKLSQ